MNVCRKIAAMALLLMGSCALAQNSDFVWDWRNQQIIGRNDPSLGNTSRLTEPERSELIDAVVLRLQKPMSDAGYDDDRIREIATTTRVRFVDVGEPHPLLVTTSMGLEGGCDSLGNCPLWVFRRSSDGFVSLLDAIAASYTSQSSESVPQLVLMRHVSQQESALMVYRFADAKLTATACYKALWPSQSADSTQPSDPKLVACDEQPKWEAAPAELKPSAEQPKQEAAPAASESKPDVQSPEAKPEPQQTAPEQQPSSDKQASPNPDQAQPQPPAQESKPEQQAPPAEQQAHGDQQASPNPDQAQPQSPAQESKPEQPAPPAEQQAPGDQQASPNADQAQPQPPAPESKPDEAPNQNPPQPNPQI